MAFVHGVIGAGGRERTDELADINLLTDVGWTTINFESRCLPPFLRLPFRLPLILGIPRENLPCHTGSAEIPREMPPSARPWFAFLIDCILLYFVAV